jgi:hypothetical protein
VIHERADNFDGSDRGLFKALSVIILYRLRIIASMSVALYLCACSRFSRDSPTVGRAPWGSTAGHGGEGGIVCMRDILILNDMGAI